MMKCRNVFDKLRRVVHISRSYRTAKRSLWTAIKKRSLDAWRKAYAKSHHVGNLCDRIATRGSLLRGFRSWRSHWVRRCSSLTEACTQVTKLRLLAVWAAWKRGIQLQRVQCQASVVAKMCAHARCQYAWAAWSGALELFRKQRSVASRIRRMVLANSWKVWSTKVRHAIHRINIGFI